MTSIDDVRENLAVCLSQVQGLTGFPYRADALANLPAGYVDRPEFDPRMVFSEAKTAYEFTATVYAARPLERQAQVLLEGFAAMSGATSVIEAVQDSTNWNVDVDYAQVTNVGRIQEVSIGGVPYFALQFDIEVVW